MVIERQPGSYIEKEDGTLAPDLNDESTCARLGLKKPKTESIAKKAKEVKEHADS